MKLGTTATLNRLTTARSRATHILTPNTTPKNNFPLIKDLISQFESPVQSSSVVATTSLCSSSSSTPYATYTNASINQTASPPVHHLPPLLPPRQQLPVNNSLILSNSASPSTEFRVARDRSSSLEMILGPMLTSTRTRL